MLTYIIRRLLLMIPTLIGITVLVYFVMAYAPGGFARALNEGSQGMGGEARRIRQEYINRYALDQPKFVQYLRWLNQVSPIGFRMTGEYVWPKDQEQKIQQALAQRAWAGSESERQSIAQLVLSIAVYADKTPEEVLTVLDEAAKSPMPQGDSNKQGPAPALFELIDAQPLGDDDFWDKLRQTHTQDPQKAVNELFREVSACAIGKSRINFGQFKFFSPDFGKDKNGRKIGELIGERLQVSMLLNLITIPLIYTVSITVGVLAARKRGGFFDVGSGAAMLGLYSVPTILAGTLMIAYLASSKYLHWFPASGVHDLQADNWPFLPYTDASGWKRGWLLDFAWHLVLPVVCLTYGGFAFMTKVMRSAVLETISADFVRTARAKGVSEHHILFHHVLRNSLLPLITMAASILPGLFVGSFVVEYIFSIKGMGLLMIEGATNKDINIIMATTLVGSMISLLSLLLRDICYALADPRVTYD